MSKFLLGLLCIAALLCGCGRKQTADFPAEDSSAAVKPLSDVLEAEEGSIVFDVRNNIGADIYEMKIAPSGIDEYGEDILKSKILKMSESLSVAFLPPDTYEYWDIRVLTENGNYYTWFNVQFGTFNEIVLEIGDDGPVFETK